MNDLREYLMREVQTGSSAYVRNLAAAEQAVLRGQFNVAKVLRAAASAQRTLALNAARRLHIQDTPPATALLTTLLHEQQLQPPSTAADPELQKLLHNSAVVHARIAEIVQRSLESLAAHPDILERDVHLFLNSCLNCGYLAEGVSSEACELCGAIRAEIQGFGPYYAATPEHLGQLTPAQALQILQESPQRVAALILAVDDARLLRKPTPEEWSPKEIVAHIIATDSLIRTQVRSILDETPFNYHPVLPWKTHEGKGYEELPPSQLLAVLQAERGKTLELFQSLAPEEWSKIGRISSQIRSILDQATYHANHDLGHIAQIERMLSQ
jgi:rubrerythrin